MARADELEFDDRIFHPHTDQIVTVVRVRRMLSKTRIHFKVHGNHGSFDVPPHTEISEAY